MLDKPMKPGQIWTWRPAARASLTAAEVVSPGSAPATTMTPVAPVRLARLAMSSLSSVCGRPAHGAPPLRSPTTPTTLIAELWFVGQHRPEGDSVVVGAEQKRRAEVVAS